MTKQELDTLVNAFDEAAGQYYWQRDQGWKDADIEDARVEYDRARAALDSAIDHLLANQKRAPR